MYAICTHTRDGNFYPRPPGGGRPRTGVMYFPGLSFLSTPSGWRATPLFDLPSANMQNFYPRPPGGGRPEQRCVCCGAARRFLSTPSGWRATSRCPIRAAVLDNFYPRPPGGGRRPDRPQAPRKAEFLSTPSGWRATLQALERPCRRLLFLSTPSGWRATPCFFVNSVSSSNFYPRPPGGGRQTIPAFPKHLLHFYPRPPGGGRLQKGASAKGYG